MVRNVSIKNIPGAMRTQEFVGKSPPRITSFVHKWTGETREYKISDLSLPLALRHTGVSLSTFRTSVGIGGTRAPTVRIFREVHEVAKILSNHGLLVVSGGVPGVDLAAHLGAIDGSSDDAIKTIAVLANPAELQLNGHIWKSDTVSQIISNNGFFLSEYLNYVEPDSPEFKERLLERDRIISGISDFFIAFECSENSATVDTAKRAINQGKKVFSFLTNHTSNRRGTLQLVDEGVAIPVRKVENILSSIQKEIEAKCR